VTWDIAVILSFLVIVAASSIALQIYLCKRSNKWLGIVFPAATLFFSLVIVFVITYEALNRGPGIVITAETFRFVREPINTALLVRHNIKIFLSANIPTVVLMGIYLTYRILAKTKNK